MTQWHPIFDDLLRKTLQDYYEVRTNVPVGDLPREADIVLVRRASIGKPPFRTLWSHLTRWNVLEFKGPTESARVNDVDLLAEVGLGIHRRLREQEPETRITRSEISFWYLANHLGKRFLRDVVELTGRLDSISAGLWRGQTMGRPIWLVSNSDLPIDVESASVRIVSEQSIEQAFELARLAVTTEKLWQTYGSLLGALFPDQRKEFEIMAAKRGRGETDLDIVLANLLEQAGPKKLVEGGGLRKIIDKISVDDLLAQLTPERRRELVKRLEAGKK